MQHQNLTQACTRVVAGMFIGVLMAAAPGAFADEVSSFNQNASFLPAIRLSRHSCCARRHTRRLFDYSAFKFDARMIGHHFSVSTL